MKATRRFQPVSPHASNQISMLLLRGGTIITDKRDYVEVQRLQSIAKIDQHGRVEWRAA